MLAFDRDPDALHRAGDGWVAVYNLVAFFAFLLVWLFLSLSSLHTSRSDSLSDYILTTRLLDVTSWNHGEEFGVFQRLRFSFKRLLDPIPSRRGFITRSENP